MRLLPPARGVSTHIRTPTHARMDARKRTQGKNQQNESTGTHSSLEPKLTFDRQPLTKSKHYCSLVERPYPKKSPDGNKKKKVGVRMGVRHIRRLMTISLYCFISGILFGDGRSHTVASR